MLAVYAIVNGHELGWTLPADVAHARHRPGAARVFLVIEARVREPLMPLGLFRLRNVATANAAGGAVGGRHVRVVLHLRALSTARARLQRHAGRAVVPARQPHHGGVLARACRRRSSCVSACARRSRWDCCCAAAGLALFARAPLDGNFWIDVFPGMALLGIGAGIAFNPLLLGAMSDVRAGRVRSRLRHREHRVHDGRRARSRGARELRGHAHASAARRGRRAPPPRSMADISWRS